MLIVFCLLIGSAGNTLAAESTPVKEEKASAENSKFDETTTQYLKKFRSINSELVAAHRELYNYNHPDNTSPGIDMAEILNQKNASREAREHEQTIRDKKNKTEERIRVLQKDAENLKLDMLKYYNGKLPKHVSDAWKNEEGYTAYLISKNK